MTTPEPTGIRISMEAAADINLLIAELQIAVDSAIAGMETATAAKGELAAITVLTKAIGESVFQLARRWNALLTLTNGSGK
jgi:hypothetical protein